MFLYVFRATPNKAPDRTLLSRPNGVAVVVPWELRVKSLSRIFLACQRMFPLR